MCDLSDYTLNLKIFDPVNKNVIGKMKDELKRRITTEFFGLKSKIYSLVNVDDKEVTKRKGVNKKISHKMFVEVLFSKKSDST